MLPDIHAFVRTRLIFNFAVDPRVLGNRLKVDWLAPQVLDGAAVCSICFLDLHSVTFGSLPKEVGLTSANCAIRWGVVDLRNGDPAVWVESRLTGSPFASFVTRLGFPGFHPLADVEIVAKGSGFRVAVEGGADAPRFAATSVPASDGPTRLFSSADAFENFIAAGVRSFAPAADGRDLNVVDLFKEGGEFERLHVEAMDDLVVAPDLVIPQSDFDGAYLKQGSRYTWSYVERLRRS
jgi:hypothetical protein